MPTNLGELASLCAKAVLLVERGERKEDDVNALLITLRTFTANADVATLCEAREPSPEATPVDDHAILSRKVSAFRGWKHCNWLIRTDICLYIGELVLNLFEDREKNWDELEEVATITGLRDFESVRAWRPDYWEDPAFRKTLDLRMSELMSKTAKLHGAGIFYFGSLLRAPLRIRRKIRLSRGFHAGAIAPPDWTEPPLPPDEVTRAEQKKREMDQARLSGAEKAAVTREMQADILVRFPKMRAQIVSGEIKFQPFVGELLDRFDPGTSASWITAHPGIANVTLHEAIRAFGQFGSDEHPCWRTIEQPTRQRIRNVLNGIREQLVLR